MTNIIPISDVRKNLPKLVDKVSKQDDRIIITVNGRAKAVIVNPEELEAFEETAEILAIPGAKKQIMTGLRQAKKGKGIPLEDLK